MLLCCLWLSAKCGQQIRAYFINAFARPIASDRGRSDLFRYMWTAHSRHTVSVMFPPVTIHDFVPELYIFLAFGSNSTGNPIIRLISSLIYTARYHQMVLAPSRKKCSVFTWLVLFEKGQTLLGFVCPFALNIPANDRGVNFPTSLSWTWKNLLVISI